MSLNTINLMGRLARDPEKKVTQSGVSVCNFTIAVDRDYRNGEEKVTDWVDCVAWRGTADFIERNFSKGRMILVSGSLQSRKWQDKDGNNLRPDAVVLFPNDERIIIDSKVSLTAYQEALKTDDDARREQLMKEHVASVKWHVDELTAKNYDRYVPNSIGYVLMFIPYESGYAAAVKTDPTLLQ